MTIFTKARFLEWVGTDDVKVPAWVDLADGHEVKDGIIQNVDRYLLSDKKWEIEV